LWKEILESKYEGWKRLKEQRLNNIDSFWWRDLNEIWMLEDWGRTFEDRFKWVVDNGKEVFFWEDNKVGLGDLKSRFPRLFSLAVVKDAKLFRCGD